MTNKFDRIYILGTFNPPTKAHLEISKICNDTFGVECYYMITSDWYIQNVKCCAKYIPWQDRAMLLIMAKREYGCNAKIALSDVFYNHEGKTIKTVEAIRNAGINNFALCIGEDNLANIDKWESAEELISQNTFIVVSRGADIPKPQLYYDYEDHFIPIQMNMNTISSTVIREAWHNKNNDIIHQMCPICVYDYLCTHANVF